MTTDASHLLVPHVQLFTVGFVRRDPPAPAVLGSGVLLTVGQICGILSSYGISKRCPIFASLPLPMVLTANSNEEIRRRNRRQISKAQSEQRDGKVEEWRCATPQNGPMRPTAMEKFRPLKRYLLY